MADKNPTATKFGTFGGVFTPSTLTILGVIMFLRFGQVVGEAGMMHALVIVLGAKVITTLTAFSISAVATNTRVKGGGAYFLISRSLGVEFGGAIGVVFFLAQAISVAMYVIGFTEAFLNVFPSLGISETVVATVTNVVVFVCVYIGAGWTIKVQYGILAALVLSLVSFYVGAIPDFSMTQLQENWSPSYPEGGNFFVMFALFFPAVTGIMAGVNMSGDLKSPSKSIPLGTIAAIAFTAVVYLSMAVLFAGTRSSDVLKEDSFVILDVAWSPMLINLGIFAATLSSALGSMMGAPRILQALARDNIFPSLRTFSMGAGASQEPRRATILTFVIAQLAIMPGDLNAIAPIITMFFMVTYGTINLACFYESITKNPSYRPSFRFSHWSSALAGALGCVGVMVLMEPVWAAAAIGAMALLQWQISRKEILSTWGDVKSGAAFERARKALLALEDGQMHPKNWRPIILALSGGAWLRNHLVEFGSWFTAQRGVLALGQVIVGDFEDRIERRDIEEAKLRKFIAGEEWEAFPAVVVESDLFAGMKSLLQSFGIGAIRPNAVLLGWSEDPERIGMFGRMLRVCRNLGKSLLVVRAPESEGPRESMPAGTIDIWWRGGRHGTLMMVLAHLMTVNQELRSRTIRVVRAVKTEAEVEKARISLEKLIEASRVRATATVVHGEDLIAALHAAAESAAVVMIGFEPPLEGEEAPWRENLTRWMPDGRYLLLVSNGEGGPSLTS